MASPLAASTPGRMMARRVSRAEARCTFNTSAIAPAGPVRTSRASLCAPAATGGSRASARRGQRVAGGVLLLPVDSRR